MLGAGLAATRALGGHGEVREQRVAASHGPRARARLRRRVGQGQRHEGAHPTEVVESSRLRRGRCSLLRLRRGKGRPRHCHVGARRGSDARLQVGAEPGMGENPPKRPSTQPVQSEPTQRGRGHRGMRAGTRAGGRGRRGCGRLRAARPGERRGCATEHRRALLRRVQTATVAACGASGSRAGPRSRSRGARRPEGQGGGSAL